MFMLIGESWRSSEDPLTTMIMFCVSNEMEAALLLGFVVPIVLIKMSSLGVASSVARVQSPGPEDSGGPDSSAESRSGPEPAMGVGNGVSNKLTSALSVGAEKLMGLGIRKIFNIAVWMMALWFLIGWLGVFDSSDEASWIMFPDDSSDERPESTNSDSPKKVKRNATKSDGNAGEACSEDRDCDSYNCTDDLCYAGDPGDPCEEDNDCDSYNCTDDVCYAGNLGDPCEEDNDCDSYECRRERCVKD
jgi:hypothetical protein